MYKQLPRSFRKTLVAGAVLAALGGGFGISQFVGSTAVLANNSPASTSTALTLIAPSFSSLAKQVRPAVVNIAVEGTQQVVQGPDLRMFPEFFRRHFEHSFPTPERSKKVKAVGSGFIIDASGHIVTNDHVIRNAKRILVTLDNGETFPAEVIGRDPRTDLAVLKIESDTVFPFVELGDSDSTQVGDWVVAVGNPFGLGGTVTAGILSARGRDIQSGPFDDYLQIDAPINRGNSGGPLFDAQGKVIGVNTAIFSPSGGNVGIGFAVPAKTVGPVTADLITKGVVDRGWLGVHIQPLPAADTDSIVDADGSDSDTTVTWNDKGVLVAQITVNSPAQKAGLQIGDRIVAVDGEPITKFRDLSRAIASKNSGDKVQLTVQRGDEELSLSADLTQASRVLAKSKSSPTVKARLGVRVLPITPEVRTRWAVAPNVKGVLVAEVHPKGLAARAGLRSGDVIVRANTQPITHETVLRQAVAHAAQTGQPLTLHVAQNGQERLVTVPVG